MAIAKKHEKWLIFWKHIEIERDGDGKNNILQALQFCYR